MWTSVPDCDCPQPCDQTASHSRFCKSVAFIYLATQHLQNRTLITFNPSEHRTYWTSSAFCQLCHPPQLLKRSERSEITEQLHEKRCNVSNIIHVHPRPSTSPQVEVTHPKTTMPSCTWNFWHASINNYKHVY